jgi:hypothetical protein
MITKTDQLKYRGRKKEKPVGYETEDLIQEPTNELLDKMQVPYFRIPDSMNAKDIRHALCGMADNVLMLPIGRGYCLCVNLELKSATGKMHGKQKTLARDLDYKIERTIEGVAAVAMEMKSMARYLRKCIENYKGDE